MRNEGKKNSGKSQKRKYIVSYLFLYHIVHLVYIPSNIIIFDFQTVSIPGEEKITRKDLAHALHICLSQTNEFSEFLLPLIMEKLESTSVDAKLDSLDLLVRMYFFI